ncbi:MAG: GNAT family N-acetyltransferase [Pseudomonadota bacterium]
MTTDYSLTIPTVETERLLLRGWRESDAKGYAELYGDEENVRFIGGTLTPPEAWRMVAQRIGQWYLRGFAMFAVELKETGEFIGHCGPNFPAGWPEHEIGYGFIKRFHGKGYATEAASASLEFAYRTLGWTTAISLIDALNTPSARLAMRLGARYERTEKVTSFTADVYRHLPPEKFLTG